MYFLCRCFCRYLTSISLMMARTDSCATSRKNRNLLFERVLMYCFALSCDSSKYILSRFAWLMGCGPTVGGFGLRLALKGWLVRLACVRGPKILSLVLFLGLGGSTSVAGGATKQEIKRHKIEKRCAVRESNPGLPRGRREFYH